MDPGKTSIDRQHEINAAFAERLGKHTLTRYSDRAIPGTLTSRPALDRLMEGVASGAIKAVVIESADRLSRTELVGHTLFDRFTFHGVRLFAADVGELDPFTFALVRR